MKLDVIDHIGVAVPSIAEALKFWEDVLGVACTGIEEVADQKVKTAFLPIKDTEIELLEPTAEDSPVAKFMANGRPGIHHMAIRVENLEEALEECKAKGIRLIDEKPRRGAGGAMIAFLHPKSTGGVLLELCQRGEGCGCGCGCDCGDKAE